MKADGGLPLGLPSFEPPPGLVRDLGEFVNPVGQATRQWIVDGLDTEASQRWLLVDMQKRGWTVAASRLLLLDDLVMEARATTYPPGIGFDGVHNLRVTLVDLDRQPTAKSEPHVHRQHLHPRAERRAHR